MKNGKLVLPSIRLWSSTPNRITPVQPNHGFPTSMEYIIHPSAIPSSLQHYINSDTPINGQKIHTHILKMGFIPTINISIKLLILHLKSGCLRYARQVFDDMPQRTLSSYNYMIGGYLKQGNAEESLGLVRSLISEGETVDGYTLSMILKASTCVDDFVHVLPVIVHSKILRLNVVEDDVLYTALVDCYAKSGKLGYAQKVFDKMIGKSVVCSTSMISGYMNQGCVNEAKEIFDRTVEKDIVVYNAMIEGYSKLPETSHRSLEIYIDMQRVNFRPNISTFASILGACSLIALFEVGRQVQCQIMKTQHFVDVRMGSALIDMYSKCGRVDLARTIFENMAIKNVFSWTSMIDGYGKNGYPAESLELFEKMQEKNKVAPNYVTFLSALSACGHAGLIDKGQAIFDSMERDYKMKPRMEHYACMVDLLGRAGSLERAWKFVKGMNEKPNSDVWAALLSSCRLYGDVELANVAANELFKLNSDEQRPGAYVVLSNTFADAGKWDRVSELREMMKTRNVVKEGGWSWAGA